MASTTLTLDRPRALKWSHRADARLGSLAKPPDFGDLVHTNRRRAFYALAAHVWAALVDRDTPFADYEDIAERLTTPEQQGAAFEALLAALIEAGIVAEKKTKPAAAPDSASGRGESSSVGAPAPDSTIARPSSGMP